MESTLCIIKPNVIKKQKEAEIIGILYERGFYLENVTYLTLRREYAEEFYAEHREKPFFNELVDFMISGPVIMIHLMKDNAVADYRELMGATNHLEAEPNTLRAKYADSLNENAVHGSDSVESAERELAFYYSLKDRK